MTTPYDDGITPETGEFRWYRILQGLAAWEPQFGRKHTTLLITFGLAHRLGIPREKAEADLFPIVAKWPTMDSTQAALTRHADMAYATNGSERAHIQSLRTLGVKLNFKGDPSKQQNRTAA